MGEEELKKRKAIDISLALHEVKALIARRSDWWAPIELEASNNYYTSNIKEGTKHCNCDK
jgi:hypothetical protein